MWRLHLALLCLASGATAQVYTASVSGVVQDTTGAVVQGASITLTHLETQQVRTSASNDSGVFAFPSLPVGPYQLEASKSGFAAYRRTGIVLTVGQAASIPVTLQLGDVTQAVTVSADVSLVHTSESTVSRLVDERQVEGLPLNGRNPAALVFLAPGVSNPVQNVPVLNTGSPILQNSLVYPTSIAPTINGVRGGGVYFSLDGANNIDPYQVVGGPFPNPDATQEFSVLTSTYGARYVSAPGGAVNIVTKSGTNEFHGSVFEFLRNGAMNARNFFAAKQDLLKRNQFGFTAGAPVRKNKLFLFGSYQRMFLRDEVGGLVSFVPNAAERSGDFSGRTTPIRDPETNQPFPGNRIPTTRFDPVIAKLLDFIPVPPASDGRIVYSRPVVQDEHQFVIKSDYVRGAHRMFGRYLFADYAWDGVAIPNKNILASFRGQTHRWNNAAFGHTYASASLVSDFRFAYVRDNSVTFAGEDQVSLQSLGAKLTTPQYPTIQSLGVTGFFSILPGNFNGWPRDNYDIAEHVTMIRGRHEISFGAEIQRIFTRLLTDNQQNFNTTFGGGITGNALSDLLLGRATSANQSDGIFIDTKGVLWGFYGEDKWRASQKLTLTLGLRWDPYWPFQGLNGRMQCFRPGVKSQQYVNAPEGLTYPGDPGCASAGTSSNIATIQPRFGFAYQLDNNAATVLRCGYGLHTQQMQTAYFLGFGRVQPFVRTFTLLAPPSIVDPWSTFPGGNPFASGFKLDLEPRAKDAPFINPGVANTLAPSLHLAYVQQWSLTLERAIGQSDVVEASYVGSKGTRLSLVADYNQPVYIPGQSTAANQQQRRPYPLIGQVNGMRDDGNSTYHSLQVTARHRARGGVTFTSNFTYSKSIDYTSSPANILLTGGGLIPDPSNPRLRRGRADFDIPYSWRTSFVWDIPTGKGRKGAAKLALSDWQLNGLFALDSGFPISAAAPFNASLTGNGLDNADLVAGAQVEITGDRSRNEKINRWFNTDAFVVNRAGTFGDSGRNIIDSQALVNFDFALVKGFVFTEQLRAMFRAEFFNLFNTPQFLPPGNALGSATFAKVTAARDPRILQLSMKLSW